MGKHNRDELFFAVNPGRTKNVFAVSVLDLSDIAQFGAYELTERQSVCPNLVSDQSIVEFEDPKRLVTLNT